MYSEVTECAYGLLFTSVSHLELSSRVWQRLKFTTCFYFLIHSRLVKDKDNKHDEKDIKVKQFVFIYCLMTSIVWKTPGQTGAEEIQSNLTGPEGDQLFVFL